MSIMLPPYQYVIDSSALFDLKNRYPENIFPGLWDRFNEMCEQRLIVAPREVRAEVKKGNDELLEWVDRFPQMFLEPCEKEIEILQDVMDFYSPQILAKYGTGVWADPFVISCAKNYRLTIIQHENLSGSYKIPHLAKHFNIPYMDLVEFFKDSGWSFTQ